MNQLYYGDNIDILKRSVEDDSIDLIYIDPPFNSKRAYNVLFESVDLTDTKAQKEAFADTWSNVSYIDEMNEIADLNLGLYRFLQTLDHFNLSKGAASYLTTMALRVYYMHKKLKDSGSFYLHCDPTMSHYLKIVMNLIFGVKNFKNEITWRRSFAHGDAKQDAKHFGRVTDVILFYVKSNLAKWNSQYTPYTEESIKRDYKYVEANTNRRYRLAPVDGPGGADKGNPHYEFLGVSGFWRYSKKKMQKLYKGDRIVVSSTGKSLSQIIYLDEAKGRQIDNFWNDIKRISPTAKERLGYPTQKPEALLERIIRASSNEGDLVADFFCGCGTTIAVAQKLNRRWIGVDISHLAIRLIYDRLLKPFEEQAEAYQEIKDNIEINGFPKDIAAAKDLAKKTEKGPFKFQDWIIEILLRGVSNPKKTADGGYDGYLTFLKSDKDKGVILIEVKSGNVSVKNIREFIDVVNTENAAIGIFVCFKEQVTQPMLLHAKQAGYFEPEIFGQRYDKIQIITVEDLLAGKLIDYPSYQNSTFKQAPKARNNEGADNSTSLFE